MGSRNYQYPLRGAATFDPRHSVPNYPLYPQDDIVVTPVVVPQRRHYHNHANSLSRPATLYGDNARTTVGRDIPTRSHRSSTLDSTQRPIIITTTDRRPHAPSSGRSGSPVRNEHRYSEASLHIPTSMSRSRSANRAGGYSPVFPPEDFARGARAPDGFLEPGRSEAYRSSRPSVVIPSSPRHATSALDIEDDYGYTKPSDLARYDLEHSRAPTHHRESMDMGYTRPNVYYNSNRGLTVETNRTNDSNGAGRTFDNRGGPPPSTRGFDRFPRYEHPPHAPVPPALDVPPSPARERRGSNRLQRPVSLYQEAPPRLDEYYRLREDERNQRQIHDLERESQHHGGDALHDDAVGARGFGIRTDTFPTQVDDRWERRDQPERVRREVERGSEDPRRRSDESLDRDHGRNGEYDKHDSRRRQKLAREDGKERRGNKDDDEEDQPKGFRESMKTGLAATAAAVGIPVLKEKVAKDDDKDKDKRHRRESDDKRDSSDDVEIVSSRAAKSYRSGDKEYIPSSSRRDHRDRKDPSPDDRDAREREEARERHRRAAEARVANGERGESSKTAARESSESGEERTGRRRRAHPFDPTDANSLREIKDQLAAAQLEKRQAEKENDRKGKEKDQVVVVEPPPPVARRVSPREPSPKKRKDDDGRGRTLAVPAHEERQVRVVSPPRDKPEPKPIKGILKQPKPKFPEDPNPIREGVAPHKTDEKLREVPVDARWTKISRKIVNPEALTIGKERFEERDDFVVVLRVLSKEEIQAYAAATATLRERRREAQREKDRDYYIDKDGEKRSSRHHRHRDRETRDDDDEEEENGERRHRRHKIEEDEDEDERARKYEHSHRRHRERGREREYAIED